MVMRLLCSRSATAALEAESLDSSNIIILSSSSSLLTPEVSVTLGAVSIFLQRAVVKPREPQLKVSVLDINRLQEEDGVASIW